MLRYFLSLVAICLATTGAMAGSIPVISVEDGARAQSVQFVDVRPVHQFIGWDTDEGRGGHIEGARDFPLSWFSLVENSLDLDNELARR
ncbi:MAG: hypothetical protein PHU72_05550, partial [Dethiosulfovibrio sp.]|nr:hypothetical protein [Dethiosulfovibrio sp.]